MAATLLAVLHIMPGSANAGSQYVVVGAEPPAAEYEPGRVLKADDTIVIPEGTVVTLLGEDGSVNAIPGPASITVTEDSVEFRGENDAAQIEQKRTTISKLAKLLSGETKNADSLGVARSLKDKPKLRGLSDPWVVSVHEDGNGCIRGEEIRLGRNSDIKTVSVAVAGDDSRNVTEMTWRKGEADLLLPGSISVEKGEIFVKAGTDRALIRLKVLPPEINPQNPVDVLGWMLDSGCEGQALAFTRQLVVDAQ